MKTTETAQSPEKAAWVTAYHAAAAEYWANNAPADFGGIGEYDGSKIYDEIENANRPWGSTEMLTAEHAAWFAKHDLDQCIAHYAGFEEISGRGHGAKRVRIFRVTSKRGGYARLDNDGWFLDTDPDFQSCVPLKGEKLGRQRKSKF